MSNQLQGRTACFFRGYIALYCSNMQGDMEMPFSWHVSSLHCLAVIVLFVVRGWCSRYISRIGVDVRMYSFELNICLQGLSIPPKRLHIVHTVSSPFVVTFTEARYSARSLIFQSVSSIISLVLLVVV